MLVSWSNATHGTDEKSSCVYAQFVSPMFVSRIEGLCDAESQEILEQLHEHCAQERFLYTHEWELGEIVIWDNRTTMHRRLPFDGDRLLWRTQSRGDKPR